MNTASTELEWCLKQSEGATFREIKEAFANRISASEVATTLADGIHADKIGFRFNPGQPQNDLLFFLRREHPTPTAQSGVTQMLAEYIWSKEDSDHGSSDVTVEPRAIYPILNEYQKVAFEDLTAAFYELFAERVLTCDVRPRNNYITFTLDRNWQYTVLTYNVETERARCFHVRAGNQRIAEEKTRRIDSRARIVAVARGAIGMWGGKGEEPLVIEVI
jgi:hypothetical protein